MQQRFAERRVNANVEWCVVIGQCHGNCAQRQFVRSFRRWRQHDVRIMNRAIISLMVGTSSRTIDVTLCVPFYVLSSRQYLNCGSVSAKT